MRKKLLTGVSAVALIFPAMAFADISGSGSEQAPQAQPSEDYDVNDLGRDVSDALDDAGDAITEGADQAAEAVEDAFEGETTLRTSAEVMGPGNLSADLAMGSDVTGSNGEKIATLYDIILPEDGAPRAVLSQGGVMGIGASYKTVPFSDLLATADGAATGFTLPLTGTELEAKQTFAYDRDGAEENAEVMAASSTSLRDLQGTTVSNPAGEEIAEITDIYVGENGEPAFAILRTDAILGFGGKQVALDYDDMTFAEGAGGPVVQLTHEQIEAAPGLNLQGETDARLQ